jgi:Protein of unknown function (DUF3096)
MASILFRIENSFGCARWSCSTQFLPNSSRGASFRKSPEFRAAIFGNSKRSGTALYRAGVCYRGTLRRAKMFLVDSTSRQHHQERFMTITAAHIQPIVALVAGVLILLMPRFLNFVVAIYLIFVGLAGLGLFKLFK